ncbi:tetratricopeptide repeat protein [Kistimonas asteriae]|uniref:tetratricopeptide repeat protein n=1 Tax=Kistimonas asteriae TaxID=517724 RepID=UPI001BA54229|nr:tetratricopeptide repeat protein [Kistimonas asteriae]
MTGVRGLLASLGVDAPLLGRLKDGETIASHKQFDPQLLEAIHAIAYARYEAGHVAEAESLFLFLGMHDHTEPRYLQGLGCCRFALGDSDSALALLEQAVVLDHQNPHALLALGSVYEASGDPGRAQQMFERAIHACGNQSQLRAEQGLAEQLLQAMQEAD